MTAAADTVVPRTRARRALATCSAAHVLHDGLQDITYVLLPLFAQTFGLTLAQTGLVRSAHRAAMAAFQMPAGFAAERLGSRNLLAFGTACTGLAFVALGHASGFVAVLLALFVAGFGSAFQHPLSSAIISHAYPGEGRRAALGTYNFAGDVGKFALGGIVSLLAVAGVHWQTPVTAFGWIAVACAVAIFVVLGRIGGSTAPAPATAAAAPAARGWGIRDRRGFAALCAIEVVDSSTRAGFLTFVAFLLIAKGVPDGWAALAVPLVFVGGMAGKLACGFLAERFGIIRTVVITEIATAAGIFLALALPAAGAFALLPLIGIAVNGTSSVLYATIGDLVEHDRLPRAFGFFYALGATCGIASPLFFGALGDATSVATSMAVVGAMVLATLPLCFLLAPALRRHAAV